MRPQIIIVLTSFFGTKFFPQFNHSLTDNIRNLYLPNYPQLSRRNLFPRLSAIVLQDSKIRYNSSILAYLKTCPADNHISGTFSRSGVAVLLSVSKNYLVKNHVVRNMTIWQLKPHPVDVTNKHYSLCLDATTNTNERDPSLSVLPKQKHANFVRLRVLRTRMFNSTIRIFQ